MPAEIRERTSAGASSRTGCQTIPTRAAKIAIAARKPAIVWDGRLSWIGAGLALIGLRAQRGGLRRARVAAGRGAVGPGAGRDSAPTRATTVVWPEPGRDRGARLGPRLGLDRVPNDEAEVDDRDLQDHHQEDDLPDGVGRHRRSVPSATRAGLVAFPEYECGTA